ncbi:LacI family DNA-binding transcriptional regulator [Butyricicoccus pullicaecorum]|nr:LacI family DNA-binding transcriptional regulator [Butyricicoccus pullicaecorum]
MTIREFAKLCDVSPATASRFFSGRGSISEPVRLRIEQMAKKTGYAPPDSFRGRRKTSSVIAVIVPNFRQCFFNDMLEQLRAHAEHMGKRLIILPMDESNPQNTLALISACEPMGVILLHESVEFPLADALSRRNMPVVVCGGLAAGRRFSAVHIDDMMAAYDGVNYLIGLGHTRIGFLSDASRAISSGFQRLTGCRKALEDAHLTMPEERVQAGGMTFEDGYRGVTPLLERCPDLTAIFAFSDDLAAGAIARLQEVGKRVPEDISVLGFDDNSMARRFNPPLTTVRQPMDQIAQKTIERLAGMQGAHDISSLTLACEIAERASCGACRED